MVIATFHKQSASLTARVGKVVNAIDVGFLSPIVGISGLLNLLWWLNLIRPIRPCADDFGGLPFIIKGRWG